MVDVWVREFYEIVLLMEEIDGWIVEKNVLFVYLSESIWVVFVSWCKLVVLNNKLDCFEFFF